MYSKNDYRYYLEHRLAESDDYLAHYGVKGMKWRKHKANRTDGTDWIRSAYDPKHSVGGMHGLENLARHLPNAVRSEAEYVKEQRKPKAKVKKKLDKIKSKLESRSTRKWVKDTSTKVSHKGNMTSIVSETTYSKKNPAAHRAGQGKAVLSNATAPIIKEAQKKSKEKKRIRKRSDDWVKKH